MFCDKCGKPAGDGEKFCRYCGSPLIRKAGPAEVESLPQGGPGQTVSGRSSGKNRKKIHSGRCRRCCCRGTGNFSVFAQYATGQDGAGSREGRL